MDIERISHRVALRHAAKDKPLRIKRTKRVGPGEYEIIRSDGLVLEVHKDDYERGLWWVSSEYGKPGYARVDVYSLREAKEVVLTWDTD